MAVLMTVITGQERPQRQRERLLTVVVVERCRYVLGRVAVGRVAHDEARFADSAVADEHALDAPAVARAAHAAARRTAVARRCWHVAVRILHLFA